MDPELRDYLEARFAETRKAMDTMRQETARRFAEARQEIGAVREVAEAARQEAADSRSEACVLHEAAMQAIKTLGDGIAMHREAMERHVEDREQACRSRRPCANARMATLCTDCAGLMFGTSSPGARPARRAGPSA